MTLSKSGGIPGTTVLSGFAGVRSTARLSAVEAAANGRMPATIS